MIFLNPPKPHPRYGEEILVLKNSGWKKAKIYWIYGPDKFFLVAFDDPEYIDGIRFEIIPSHMIKLG
jgi:hypothetical protein